MIDSAARQGPGAVSCDLLRNPAGEPAIRIGMIHGLGARMSVWQPCAALLPDHVQAWGFGFPWDAADGGGWATEPDSRHWLLRGLKLAPAPLDVYVAHSFGATVLLDQLVQRRELNCRGLVLISPFYRPAPEAFDWAALSHYLNDFDDLLHEGILLRRETTAGRPPEAELLAAMIERVRERISPYGWLRFFDLFTRTPFFDLAKLDLPCLVIAGGRDTAAYPDDCRSLARNLPDAAIEVLPSSGHFSMVDDPDRVAGLITDFLTQRVKDAP